MKVFNKSMLTALIVVSAAYAADLSAYAIQEIRYEYTGGTDMPNVWVTFKDTAGKVIPVSISKYEKNGKMVQTDVRNNKIFIPAYDSTGDVIYNPVYVGLANDVVVGSVECSKDGSNAVKTTVIKGFVAGNPYTWKVQKTSTGEAEVISQKITNAKDGAQAILNSDKQTMSVQFLDNAGKVLSISKMVSFGGSTKVGDIVIMAAGDSAFVYLKETQSIAGVQSAEYNASAQMKGLGADTMKTSLGDLKPGEYKWIVKSGDAPAPIAE